MPRKLKILSLDSFAFEPLTKPDCSAGKIGQAEINAGLHRAVDRLTSRERDVIQQRYGLFGGGEKTLSAIAKEFGCSRERIRQIQKNALSKLRDSLPECIDLWS